MLENLLIPDKWKPKYLLKRINEEDIKISKVTRDEILKQLANGGRFVQIGEYTVMLNSIKSIDPLWGAKNIPPPPSMTLTTGEEYDKETNTYKERFTINPEWEEWQAIFGKEIKFLEKTE